MACSSCSPSGRHSKIIGLILSIGQVGQLLKSAKHLMQKNIHTISAYSDSATVPEDQGS